MAGVLCWEIYHAGRMPLPGLSSGEVRTGIEASVQISNPMITHVVVVL